MAKQRAKIGQDFFSPTTSTPASNTQQEERQESKSKSQKTKNSKLQTTKKPKEKKMELPKQQLTLYFNSDTVDEITMAQLHLKRVTGLRGHSLSNSAITEAALKIVLQDLEKNGSASLLAKYITSHK